MTENRHGLGQVTPLPLLLLLPCHSGAVGGLRRGYVNGCPPRAHLTPRWHDLPSVSLGAHPGGTAPPSSGTGVHSPSLAVAPRDMCAGLRQDQRPRLPRTSSLEPGTSQTQAPVHNANLHGKPPKRHSLLPQATASAFLFLALTPPTW